MNEFIVSTGTGSKVISSDSDLKGSRTRRVHV